jgi:nucleotide-binding universal stress UspA family protein
VLNGLLTARLGLAAIEVARPLPFAALPPPKLADIAGDLLRRRSEEAGRKGSRRLIARARRPTLCHNAYRFRSARALGEPAMFQKILVPVDLADPEFVKPALTTAVELAKASGGAVRLINVIPMTPVMLAEYVPPISTCSSAARPRKRSPRRQESGLDAGKVSTVVRQGGIYHEVLEEAKAFGCDIIVMSSHRPAMKTYFLGSNAGHMVRYAKCSVLVVRKPA